MSVVDPSFVVVKSGIAGYPTTRPFHPSTRYPEYPFPEHIADETNATYEGVRETFRLLGMDAENFGSPGWNPLKDIVAPGDLVVLKPNLVRHWNGAEDDITALVTHGSVIRAVLDYVVIALKGEGEVIVGDAPVQETDFESLVRQNGLADAVPWVAAHVGNSVKVTLLDWRKERAHVLPGGTVVRHEQLPGDPRGYVEVDLGRRSFLDPISKDHEKFRVTNYDCGAMARVHNGEHNQYLISGSVLRANAVITLPKMKPHGKAGITCSLKNNVGINGHKDWLPHHRKGSAQEGGDEYEHKSLRKKLVGALVDGADRATTTFGKRAYYYAAQVVRKTRKVVPQKDPHSEGSWHGNDTVWRMVLDLNRVLLFVDSAGQLHDQQQRKYLGIVDGIVAGEGNGPLHVTSKNAGILVAGYNPTPIDTCCAHLMGFDHRKIPLLRSAFGTDEPMIYRGTLDDIRIRSDHEPYERLFTLGYDHTLTFRPPRGWKGRIEID